MENAVQIRGATAQDAQVFFALNLAFNGEGVASPQEAALVLAHPGSERVLLAFVDGEPAGFLCGLLKRSACYSRPSAEVTELYVCPAYRRQGVARQLLEAFFELCRQEGAEAVTVLTGEDNAPAQALYQRMGFAPSGEVHFEQEL